MKFTLTRLSSYKQLPGIPVVIGKERAITGQFAWITAEVIILVHWQPMTDVGARIPKRVPGNGCILP